MPRAGGVSFRRVRVPVGDREIWIDGEDPPDGCGPVPFTVWTIPGLGDAAPLDFRLVTEADAVGWRRAPDPVAGPGDTSKGAEAASPGPEERG